METPKRKKGRARNKIEDGDVEVRVSARAPRKQITAPPTARAQNLATALLEGVIGQVAQYVENSHAVERLIRVQTTKVLRELARDPELGRLIRAQVEQYLADLASHPEILEPLVKTQVDHYLDRLARDQARKQTLETKINPPDTATLPPLHPKPRPTKLKIE